jgi:hypothetical protein
VGNHAAAPGQGALGTNLNWRGLIGGLDALEQFELAGVLEFKCQNTTEQY